MRHVFLDSHPLGLLSNPTLSSEGAALTAWVASLLRAGHRIDVILAAQALTEARHLGMSGTDAVVATSNVSHLSRFMTADLWTNIHP